MKLLTLLCVLQTCCLKFSALTLPVGETLVRVYNELDEHLAKEVPLVEEGGGSTQLDLANKAIDWLKEKSAQFDYTTSYSGALELLEAFRDAVDSSKCDQTSYEIVRENNKAVGDRVHLPLSYLYHPTRIQTVVNYLSQMHAFNCRPKYMEKFKTKLEILDEERVDRVVTLRNGYLNGKIVSYIENKIGMNWTLCSTFELKAKIRSFDWFTYKRFLDIKWFLDDKVLSEALDYFEGQAEPSAAMSTSGRADILNNYILEPCNYYSTQLGADLFKPALYDAQMYVEEMKDVEHILLNLDYYLGRTAFQICSNLLDGSNHWMLNKAVG